MKEYIAEYSTNRHIRRYYVREGELFYNLYSPFSDGSEEKKDVYNNSVHALSIGMYFVNASKLVILNQGLVDKYLMLEELMR